MAVKIIIDRKVKKGKEVVVSTWQSADDWKNWEKNSERKKILARIERLMVRPTKTRIYIHA